MEYRTREKRELIVVGHALYAKHVLMEYRTREKRELIVVGHA